MAAGGSGWGGCVDAPPCRQRRVPAKGGGHERGEGTAREGAPRLMQGCLQERVRAPSCAQSCAGWAAQVSASPTNNHSPPHCSCLHEHPSSPPLSSRTLPHLPSSPHSLRLTTSRAHPQTAGLHPFSFSPLSFPPRQSRAMASQVVSSTIDSSAVVVFSKVRPSGGGRRCHRVLHHCQPFPMSLSVVHRGTLPLFPLIHSPPDRRPHEVREQWLTQRYLPRGPLFAATLSSPERCTFPPHLSAARASLPCTKLPRRPTARTVLLPRRPWQQRWPLSTTCRTARW